MISLLVVLLMMFETTFMEVVFRTTDLILRYNAPFADAQKT